MRSSENSALTSRAVDGVVLRVVPHVDGDARLHIGVDEDTVALTAAQIESMLDMLQSFAEIEQLHDGSI